MLMMPTFIVVEDAHWVDDASRLLLRYVAASQTPRPWFVLITTRPSADSLVGRGGPGQRLELAPLDVDSATTLALAVAAEHALSEEAVEDIAFVLRATRSSCASSWLLRARTTPASFRNRSRRSSPRGSTRWLRLTGCCSATRPSWGRCSGSTSWGRSSLTRCRRPVTPSGGSRSRSSCSKPTTVSRLPARSPAPDRVRRPQTRRRSDIHGRVGLALERHAAGRADEEAAILAPLPRGGGRRARMAIFGGSRRPCGVGLRQRRGGRAAYGTGTAAAELQRVDVSDRARVLEALGDMRERFGAFGARARCVLPGTRRARGGSRSRAGHRQDRALPRPRGALRRGGRGLRRSTSSGGRRGGRRRGARDARDDRGWFGERGVPPGRLSGRDRACDDRGRRRREGRPRGAASTRSSWPASPIPISGRPTPFPCSTARSRSARSTACTAFEAPLSATSASTTTRRGAGTRRSSTTAPAGTRSCTPATRSGPLCRKTMSRRSSPTRDA